MSGPSEILATLASRGATVTTLGDNIRVAGPKGCLTADLKEELLARKPELLQFLTLQERILAMRLSDFEAQGLALRVEVAWASETIWFVSNEVPARDLVSGGVPRGRIWTVQELRSLLSISNIEDQQIATIEKAKSWFDASVITTRSLPSEKPDQTDQHPIPCVACKGTRWWRSIHGAVTCVCCHAPAGVELVAAWIEGGVEGSDDADDTAEGL